MNEKKMGRKFKVGDKVKLKKAGEEADFFATEFREGDTAEIVEVNSFDGSISREYKKKRKYFRMGDFVKLKDSACLKEDSIFGDITHSATGVVCGMGYDGALIVHFTTETGYNFDRVLPKALRLATKEERKTLRKHKVAKITYDDLATEEIEQDTEVTEAKIPPEYDVKVGDIVEVTEDVLGHSVGKLGEVTELLCLDNPETRNIATVIDFSGETRIERNVKLVYRKPETKSK